MLAVQAEQPQVQRASLAGTPSSPLRVVAQVVVSLPVLQLLLAEQGVKVLVASPLRLVALLLTLEPPLAARPLLTIPTISAVVVVVVPLPSSLLISAGLVVQAPTEAAAEAEVRPVPLAVLVLQPQHPSLAAKVATGSSSLPLGNSLGSANAPCLSI